MKNDKFIRVTPEAYKAVKRMAKQEQRTLRQTLERCVLAREIASRGEREK